jgi:DNA-binding IclR family transcriptional regulator
MARIGAVERSEISRHEVVVFQTLAAASPKWLSSADLAERAQVAPRTARAHALKLVRRGVVEQAAVFPGHRYRLAEFAEQRNRGYMDRLRQAAEVLDISPESA